MRVASALLVLVLALTGCQAADGEQEGPAAPSPSTSTAAPDAAPDPTLTPTPTPAPAEPSLLLATLADGDSIAVIDPAAETPVVDEIVVGAAPWDVEATSDGTTAFVSTAEGLAIVDLATRTRTALVPYLDQPATVTHGEYRDGGLGLAIAPDGDTVYVAVHSWPEPAAVEVFDVASGAFVASAPVGVRPFQLLVVADGSEVYSIDHDTYTVTIVDAATLETRAVEIAPFGSDQGFAGWEKPHYAALDADGTLLLPMQGLVLARLDPATGDVTTTEMHAASHSHGTALAEGLLLTVGTGPFGTATEGPSLDVLDIATGEEHVLPLEHPHETVVPWTDPETDATFAVLAGGYTRDGWWEGLTLVELDAIDVTTGEVRELPLDGRPQDLEVVHG